jgi:hypothetical protein
MIIIFADKQYSFRARSLIRNKNQLFSLRDTTMRLRSQWPLHVQGDAGHPGKQGGGPKKKNQKNGGPRRRIGTRGS